MTIERIDLERLIALKAATEGAAQTGGEGAAESGAEGAVSGFRSAKAQPFAERKATMESEDSAATIGNPQSKIRNSYAPLGDGESLRCPLPASPKGRPRKVDATIKQLIPRLL